MANESLIDQDAIQDAVDTVRASGGDVSPEAVHYMEQVAKGEMTLEEARRRIVQAALGDPNSEDVA